ncbi:MAG: Gfo/Idh/MocA family oxidoreductase, partial [Acidobacteriota bacterium]
MRRSRLPIGLAGLGVHGRRYAAHLLRGDVPEAELVAVHTRDAAKGVAWAAEHGVAFHAHLSELAADAAVEAVAIVLPPAEHPAAVEHAVRCGVPVLVEKPIAADVAAARAMVESARRAGVPAMVAQTLRYDSLVGALRAALPQLGPLHLVAINQRFEPSGRSWLDDPVQGGVLSNTGVHGLDLLRVLTGAEIVAARAMSRSV